MTTFLFSFIVLNCTIQILVISWYSFHTILQFLIMGTLNRQECIKAIWETGIPVWVVKLWHPKIHFLSFVFSVIFQEKIC